MTSLRQRMIEDLHLRGYAERTVGAYVSAVARLAQYHHTASDRLTEDQLRDYLVHLSAASFVARLPISRSVRTGATESQLN